MEEGAPRKWDGKVVWVELVWGWGWKGGGVCGTLCPQSQRHIFLPGQVNLETSQNARGLPGRLRCLLTHLPSQRSFSLLWGC